MTFHIDTREGSVNLIAPLRARGYAVREFGDLPSDVEFVGCGPGGKPEFIGIEYKSPSDAVKSIESGRLQDTQLRRMIEQANYTRIHLLIEGGFRPSASGVLEESRLTDPGWAWRPVSGGRKTGARGWTYRQFVGALMSLEETCGLCWDRTWTQAESVEWLIALYEGWQKPYEERRTARKMDTSYLDGLRPPGLPKWMPTPDATETHRMLAGMRGLGEDRSYHLSEHFGGMEALVGASVAEIAAVSWVSAGGRKMRIGEALAQRVYAKLRGAGKKER